MMCRKCGNEGVRNTALGKEFYYCRTCKVEIGLEPVAPAPAPDKAEDPWARLTTPTTPSPTPGQLIFSGGTMKWFPSTPNHMVPPAKVKAGLKCPCPDSSCTTTYTYDPNTDVYIDSWGYQHHPIDLMNQYGNLPS